MKKFIHAAVLMLLLMSMISFSSSQLKIEGKGEEFHRALQLEFVHAADHAKAIEEQVSLPRAMSMEITRRHMEEIGHSLENARVLHSMVHKTFSDQDAAAVKENHNGLYDAHTKALDAFQQLKVEIVKKEMDASRVQGLANTIYRQTDKAAAEHRDGMKKLGVE